MPNDLVEKDEKSTILRPDSIFNEQRTRALRCPKEPPGTIRLSRHRGGFWLVGFYSCLAIFSWAITCICCFRPLNARSYTHLGSEHEEPQIASPRALYIGFYRTSEVLDSIVGMLTIPIASTISIKAAVTFTQKHKHHVNARQGLVLADRGWSDVSVVWNVLVSKKWRKSSATSFFFAALALNIVGLVVSPLKEVLVSRTTTKTPSRFNGLTGYNELADWSDLFFWAQNSERVVGVVRDRLMSTNMIATQPHLWHSPKSPQREFPNSLREIRGLNEPFLCAVPALFNTGLLHQFAPRLNWTVDYQLLTTKTFPGTCIQNGTNFIEKYTAEDSTLSLELCMLGNLTVSPWHPIQGRQDISETLYFKSAISSNDTIFSSLTVQTSAGYFELPNYHRGATPGPLLREKPNLKGGVLARGAQIDNEVKIGIRKGKPQQTHPGMQLDTVTNKGPLLTLALALFGDASLMAGRRSRLNTTALECREQNLGMTYLIQYHRPPCHLSDDIHHWHALLSSRAGYWDPLGAIFIASEAWLIDALYTTESGTLRVSGDPGIDTIIPAMSIASMTIISVLLLVFILGLFGMAWYAWSDAHWTAGLDAFAILRIGAAAGEKLKFQVGQPIDRIEALDEIPCWVGDAEPDADHGLVKIGAEWPLQLQRRYTTTRI